LQADDSGLIENILNGNLSAFNSLMQRYEQYVYTIALSFGKNQDNALDITQNVFTKVYQKLFSFRKQSSFKSWLARISYNEGVNWVRKNQNRHKHESFEEEHEKFMPVISQEDEYLAKENKSALIRSLYTLNTRHRLAVVLRYFENQSIKEIAATLECSEGVVKNILFRSLQKLKENLQEKGDME
jgi:RNA polymerase sigma-70 factor, ECF subfamily